jgi:hypothetical protein
MAQVFHPSANTVARATIVVAIFLAGGVGWAFLGPFNRSSYLSGVDVPRDQPVPFSHKHHVAGLGIDCRYCHTTVETAAFAGIPATETCMSCHLQIWTGAEMLEPVRASFRSGKSLEWTRVHDLPGFVYFDHSIHVNKGVGCASCHGRVDLMPLTRQVNTLYMEWCLECHRQPEKFVRPRDKVFQMDYAPPADQLALGRKLVAEYKIQKLTDCWTCHR